MSNNKRQINRKINTIIQEFTVFSFIRSLCSNYRLVSLFCVVNKFAQSSFVNSNETTMIAARQGFTIFPWIMWDIHMFASRSFSCFHCVTTKINGTTKDRVGSDCFSSPNCFHSRSLYWWNTVVSLCVFHGGVCLFLSRLDRHTWTLQKTITVIQSRIKLNCFCIYSSTHKTVSAQRYAAWFRFYCCFDSAVRCIQQKRRANQKNSFYFEFTLLVVILFSSAVFFLSSSPRRTIR